MAYSYSLIRSTPLVPRFPSFGNLDEMHCSKATAIPKRNTRAKLNHGTAKVTARAYDYELIAFNIITVYVTSTLFPLLLCIRSVRFRSRPASFETDWPGSKHRAGGCESGRNIYAIAFSARLNGLQVDQVDRENDKRTSTYTQLVLSKLVAACNLACM